jgi:hypothetical protein
MMNNLIRTTATIDANNLTKASRAVFRAFSEAAFRTAVTSPHDRLAADKDYRVSRPCGRSLVGVMLGELSTMVWELDSISL